MFVSAEGKLAFYFQNKSIAGIADTNDIMKYVHKHIIATNTDLI